MILDHIAMQVEPQQRQGAAEVRRAITRILVTDRRLGFRYLPLRLAFEDGSLELQGAVRSLAAKRRAVQLVASHPDVHSVTDHLRVIPLARMSDETIAEHLVGALLEEVAFCECAIRTEVAGVLTTVQEPVPSRGEIEVAVDGGVVTLQGLLPTRAQACLAGVLAWWVPGTEDVIQELRVLSAGADEDTEITAAVRSVFDRDPIIAPGQIRVQTNENVVTLTGLVWSEEERRMAESDAWYVQGVADVVNALRVAECA